MFRGNAKPAVHNSPEQERKPLLVLVNQQKDLIVMFRKIPPKRLSKRVQKTSQNSFLTVKSAQQCFVVLKILF